MNRGSAAPPQNSRRQLTDTSALNIRISISTVSVASPYTVDVPPSLMVPSCRLKVSETEMMREHGQLAMDAHVAGELDRALVGDRLEPVEVDAGLDLDAARRDAEIDRDRGAEFERRFDLVHAARR